MKWGTDMHYMSHIKHTRESIESGYQTKKWALNEYAYVIIHYIPMAARNPSNSRRPSV